MPDEDRRSVLRVALLIEEPRLRADILDRLDARPGVRLVDSLDEADVVLGDGSDLPDRDDDSAGGLDPPGVTLVSDRGFSAPPAGSLVLADASATLLEAVLRVAAAGYFTRPDGFDTHWTVEEVEIDADETDDSGPRLKPSLTPREREVLAILAEGAPNKVIARRLQIAPSTAKFHVASLLGKLGARSRLDAVAVGARLGLVLL